MYINTSIVAEMWESHIKNLVEQKITCDLQQDIPFHQFTQKSKKYIREVEGDNFIMNNTLKIVWLRHKPKSLIEQTDCPFSKMHEKNIT